LDLLGDYVATAGDDKKILIWSIKNEKAIKTLEGHKGSIHHLVFSADSENIFSSGDDGKVYMWNWKSAVKVISTIAHPAAVRCFDFDYRMPHVIFCGRNDGYISVWNTEEVAKIDEIPPDPQWSAEFEPNLTDNSRNHQGAIMDIKISSSRQFLASCSNDNTCKLWKSRSYQKLLADVKKVVKETSETKKRFEGYIDVLDDRYNDQFELNNIQYLKMGDLEIFPGYHADLKFTFRHEATVTACAFSANSELLLTGSADATCRMWSTSKGDPLFQINLPYGVSSMHMDFTDTLYLSCGSRLMV
jgi:WD40 repeat protein